MRSRRLEERAVEAATVLLYDALIGIRALAFRGASLADAGGSDEHDRYESIRMLADACHNLPPAMRPSVAQGRTHRVTDAMNYLAKSATGEQRLWIETTLRGKDIDPTVFGF